jgi:hypothetical protein
MRKTLSFISIFGFFILLAAGCNGPDVVGPTIEISKEDLIARLNNNSAAVKQVVSWNKIQLKDSEHPEEINAEATFAFQKPSTICLVVSKLQQYILIVKSDGKTFGAYDYENQKGWQGRVEYLNNAQSESLFNFRPDLLSEAMAVAEIDAATTAMSTTENGEYLLKITDKDGMKRDLYVSGDKHVPVRQVAYGKDGEMLMQVTYDEIRDVTLADGTEVFVPSGVTITGREEGSYLKISNADPEMFTVNNEKAFKGAMGESGSKVKFPEGAELNELQPDGTWRPVQNG